MRTTHYVLSNTPEWHALRMTFNGTASEVPVMMGLSSNMSRDELIREKAEGIRPEPDSFTQRLYDSGHENERLARPLAEKIVGEELFPTTVSREISNLLLGASLDGETLAGSTIWEHKSLNQKLAASVPNGDLDLEYKVQMEQQFMTSGAGRCLFMASKDGNEETAVSMWYYPDEGLQQRIILEWKQFWIDVDNYNPEVEVIAPVANAVTELPMVSVSVTGQIAIVDNFDLFEKSLHDFIDNRLITDPETDQDFADLGLQIKAMKNAETALDASEKAIIAQIPTVEEKQRIKNMLFELTRSNRLASEKLLKQKKDSIKLAVLNDTNSAFSGHMKALNERLGGDYMPPVNINVAGAMKGRSTLTSVKGAANNELARAKIEANGIADKIQLNLKMLNAESEYQFLFRDLTSIVQKDSDDFALIVKSRIAEHKATEECKLEAERERIRLEEEQKLEADRERIRAEEQAKAEAEQRRISDKEREEREQKEAKDKAERDRVALERYDAETKQDKPSDDERADRDETFTNEHKKAVMQGFVAKEPKTTAETISQSLIDNGIGKTTAKKVAELIFGGKIDGVSAV